MSFPFFFPSNAIMQKMLCQMAASLSRKAWSTFGTKSLFFDYLFNPTLIVFLSSYALLFKHTSSYFLCYFHMSISISVSIVVGIVMGIRWFITFRVRAFTNLNCTHVLYRAIFALKMLPLFIDILTINILSVPIFSRYYKPKLYNFGVNSRWQAIVPIFQKCTVIFEKHCRQDKSTKIILKKMKTENFYQPVKQEKRKEIVGIYMDML